MSCQIYKYRFDRSISPKELEETFMLAILATESLHGPALVRMECRFLFEKEDRRCTIYAASHIGRDLATLFTGFATREYGESAVRIECIAAEDDSAKHDPETTTSCKQEAVA